MIAGVGRAARGRAADGAGELERWLSGDDAAARRLAVAAVAAGVLAAVATIGAGVVLAITVASVTAGATLPEVIPNLLVLGVSVVLRAGGLAGTELLAQRGAARVAGERRGELLAALTRLDPAGRGQSDRIGGLASLATDGIEAIETYLTSFAPARAMAVIVPLLVAGVVLVADPPSVLVLLLTGPVLVLILWAIGSRARALTDRRFAELRWMNGLFLDLLRGLGTLRLFGRAEELGETIRDTSRRSGETTMEVLRTAFQTALVLEWGAAVAMAVIAVEVSLRLMVDGITFERALVVLVVAPEFFAPLRGLAIRYHSGAAGRTAATAIRDVLGTPGVEVAVATTSLVVR